MPRWLNVSFVLISPLTALQSITAYFCASEFSALRSSFRRFFSSIILLPRKSVYNADVTAVYSGAFLQLFLKLRIGYFFGGGNIPVLYILFLGKQLFKGFTPGETEQYKVLFDKMCENAAEGLAETERMN